ncbi:ankyrin repeat-containing domain protein [Apodospora peruviana]|uniref:Ankyrin repeat-containing domain protein n=1 Tax=Apodospora peruviana TaxID=516989 RepID=A0AAE0HZY8_9PEZI|nr:ankyrin repeat-containing domain protein [Apodospora peruviana]
MAELTPEFAITISPTKQNPDTWDDASTLASRSSWTSRGSEETLASLQWKSRPRQSDCRELLKSNRSMVKPTPSIQFHGTRCTCSAAADDEILDMKHRSADDILADKISAAADLHRIQRKAKKNGIKLARRSSSALSLSLSHRQQSQRRLSSTGSSIIQNAVTRLFSSATSNTPAPAASSHKVADLCFGCSALDIAKVTRYLFDENIPINAQNHVGTTPLMAALRAMNPQDRPRAHLAMISFLLDCGADPNASNGVHSTPGGAGTMNALAAASSLNLPSALRLLLAHGAAVDAPLNTIPMFKFGGHGLTALHVAAFADKPACLEILLKHGGADTAATFDACRAIDDPLKPVSSKKQKRESKLWTTGITALHLAVDASSPGCTELLLRYGADPMARDSYGRTPLHWAMEAGNATVVRQLLAAKGVDADVKDRDGETPLAKLVARLECGAPRQGHPDIARMLLAHGADPDLRYPQDLSVRERLLKLDRWRGLYEPIFDESGKGEEMYEKKVL